MNDHGSVENYLKANAKDPEDYERILNNYISSLAGQCTASYLLGLVDRHLHNLMVSKDGIFYHIDFGWIFGQEPNTEKIKLGGFGRLATKFRISMDMI